MTKPKTISGKDTKTLIEALRMILQSNTVGTQEEIKLALEELGHEVNQSKISRLLRRLGAVKTTNERRQTIYTLPIDPAPPASKSIMSELITSIHTNESLIVIHTNPGSASLIGRLLDHHREPLMILGTVAGDDTVFIAPQSVKKIMKTLQLIQTFLAQMT
ncbi:Arginine repressor [Aquicella siphonis]|uniref:Arginine repressor n=1 Tax=Aquicella siphonis TaxID=254247 RepID=A0A5E4PKS0_9COXI|nr:ArgR family transcriptional regulator [Aquicella siphonis]VVC77007.1 Arginine repressor [Aquicella siphonis]